VLDQDILVVLEVLYEFYDCLCRGVPGINLVYVRYSVLVHIQWGDAVRFHERFQRISIHRLVLGPELLTLVPTYHDVVSVEFQPNGL
jgi:hypothetical protein